MAENMALFGSEIIAKKEGGGAHQRSSTFASFLFLILLYTI